MICTKKELGIKIFIRILKTPKQNIGGSKFAANLGGASKGGYLQFRRIGIIESIQKFGCSKF